MTGLVFALPERRILRDVVEELKAQHRLERVPVDEVRSDGDSRGERPQAGIEE